MASSLTEQHRDKLSRSVRSTLESKRRQGLPVNGNAAKTRCPAGHEYSPDNTSFSDGGRVRHCRKCNAIHSREFRARVREQKEQRLNAFRKKAGQANG